MKVYTIIFSNYTGQIFAWAGTKKEQVKFLGNREILGEVHAEDESSAIKKWRGQSVSY